MPAEKMTLLEALELSTLGFEINLNDGKISEVKEREE